MKYVSKPVEIEATQWLGPQSFPMAGVMSKPIGRQDTEYFVITIHGQETKIAPGDYIIQEPDGIHYYPCKPDIFERKYELKKGSFTGLSAKGG